MLDTTSASARSPQPTVRTCPECQNGYADDVPRCPQDGRGLSWDAGADELIGRTVGSYRVERLLGKGGMGAVYLGVHPAIGSRVAIKFLHPQLSDDARIVDRFYNEARAVNLIAHDNILKILDLNVTADHRHYFVMEFLDGRPLQALLRRGDAVPLEVSGPILLQVCDALEAAHRKGIIHRDLKPDNVYLIGFNGKKNFVKVVDFGIARLSNERGTSRKLTQTGMVMGTPAYMSPEQGSGASSSIDGRSDVYSIGILMFQLATGKLPFAGSNFGEVLMAHLQRAPPRPGTINPAVPAAHEAIILRCLEKQREDRYQSMRELRLAIDACMDQLGIAKDLPQADVEQLTGVESSHDSNPGPRTPPRHPTVTTEVLDRPRDAKAPMRRFALYAAIAIVVAAAALSGSRLVHRRERRQDVPRPAPAKATAPEAAVHAPAESSLVVLSVSAEPTGTKVIAAWQGGEKKGIAPLSIDVPRSAKIHLEFRKSGYKGHSLDLVADEAQNVRAALEAVRPRAPANAAPERMRVARRAALAQPEARSGSVEAEPRSRDGLIDVDDAVR